MYGKVVPPTQSVTLTRTLLLSPLKAPKRIPPSAPPTKRTNDRPKWRSGYNFSRPPSSKKSTSRARALRFRNGGTGKEGRKEVTPRTDIKGTQKPTTRDPTQLPSPQCHRGSPTCRKMELEQTASSVSQVVLQHRG